MSERERGRGERKRVRERARELLKRVSERAKERARANIFEILNKFKKAIDVS